MAISWAAFSGFLIQLAYFTLRTLVHGFQHLMHKFNGVDEQKQSITNGAERKNVVQVFRVLWRLPCVGISVKLEDDTQFIMWHEDFTTTDAVLQPQMSLYFIDDKFAYLVEVPDEVQLHNTQKHPFFYMTQQLHCTRVYVIPLQHFIKLTNDEIGDPKCDLSFLLHSARVGSTAVTQAMYNIPGLKVMSESCFIQKHLFRMSSQHKLHDYLTSNRFYDVGEAAIRFMFKDFQPGTRVFYKAFGLLDYCLIPMINARFPSSKIITMHRDGLGTCRSHCQAFQDTYAYDFAAYALKNSWLRTIFKRFVARVLFVVTNGMTHEFLDHLRETRCSDIFLYHYVRWVANCLQYREFAVNRMNVMSVMFHDLSADNNATMRKIFDFLGIPQDQMTHAIEALNRDSQAGTKLSRNFVKKNDAWQSDEKTLVECETLNKKYGLPALGEKLRFCTESGIYGLNGINGLQVPH